MLKLIKLITLATVASGSKTKKIITTEAEKAKAELMAEYKKDSKIMITGSS